MSNGDRKKTGRRALPITIIVLATIIGIVSVFALWAKRQLLETETWSTTSEQLIQDADIQASLNTFIVTTIFDNVDVEAELANRLPPQLAPLAAPISGALRSGADEVVSKALSEPKVQQLFVDASAAAQSKLIALIDDEGEFVATTGGVVTLDLTSVVESVTAQLGLPDVASKLPPEASWIEIMKSSELDARPRRAPQPAAEDRLRAHRARPAALRGRDRDRRQSPGFPTRNSGADTPSNSPTSGSPRITPTSTGGSRYAERPT